jgi:spore germination cell wall hydrolase CwlJ-like protein
MKSINNIIVILVVSFGLYHLMSYQYDKGYYKKAYSKLSISEQYKQLECLTQNIYYEASGEDLAGKIAVAQVTLNRVESKLYPDTICKVVYQSSQFSWVKDKPKRLTNINKQVYNDSREVAKKVLLEGERLDSVGNSLYYHADYVNPVWAKSFIRVAKIGHHIFYERG